LRISAAHDEWNHEVEALVAMAKGYFREEGLEDVELIAFADDEAAQIEVLASGSVDICLDPQTRRVLAARDQGADAYIVGCRRAKHNFIFFGQKWMKSLDDLRGQTLRLDEEGAPALQLKQVLKLAGLEWGKDVKIVNRVSAIVHNPAESERRFLAGEDLILNGDIWDVERWQSLGYPLLADTNRLLPPRQDRIVAAGKMTVESPDTVKAFLKGYIRAGQFITKKENLDELWRIVEQAGFLDNETDRKNYSVTAGGFAHRKAHDGSIPLDGIEQAIRESREEGRISDRLTLDRVVVLDPLRQAQKELGIPAG
jgi:ABC-type nitrate/sulfonate/bicarbonate transport system substrate-binding protein